ncbi:MAG: hypothetical protein V7L12_09410, partial [Nostoc sp.]
AWIKSICLKFYNLRFLYTLTHLKYKFSCVYPAMVILLEDFGGESLQQLMHKRPDMFSPMPLYRFLSIAIAVCDILGRIHAGNIIHKDINLET